MPAYSQLRKCEYTFRFLNVLIVLADITQLGKLFHMWKNRICG